MARGTENFFVNQRYKPSIDGLFVRLGTFEFDETTTLTVTNENTDGYVVIDGAQWIPAD